MLVLLLVSSSANKHSDGNRLRLWAHYTCGKLDNVIQGNFKQKEQKLSQGLAMTMQG